MTTNELGSAALMLAGVYLLVASLLGRFPRLKFGGSEINPNEVDELREDSHQAKSDSVEAKEGLGAIIERIEVLESRSSGSTYDHTSGTQTGIRTGTAIEPGRTIDSPALVAGLDPRLSSLAQRYNEIRWTMPSGNTRTARMTSTVNDMIQLCSELDVPMVNELLVGEDRGLRLLAVAYLNARPDPSRISHLVVASTTEDKPFNEYWALQTLRKTLRGHCGQLTANLRRQLQNRMDALRPGVDRWRLIQAILNDCP